MAWKLYAAPAIEPVTLAEAKLACRVDIADDDALITAFITAARETVELIARRALINQTWDLVLDAFPGEDRLTLPRPPLSSVTSITYVSSAGVSAQVAAASYYVDTQSEPGRVVLNTGYSWPATTLRIASGVTVRYVAGYGAAASAVPERYKVAIKLLVAHWYENRAAVETSGAAPQEVPLGVVALLWLDRNLGF